MRLQYIAIFILASAVALLGYIFVGLDTKTPPRQADFTPTDDKGVVRVRITETGFEPKIIRVRADASVLWQNERAKKHWPASNDHPTHQAYPDKSPGDCAQSSFDTCRGLGKGESWSFKFEKTGSWRYHDHLFPALTGSVIVGEKASIQPSSLFTNFSLRELLGFGPSCPSSAEFREMDGSVREERLVNIAKNSPSRAWTCLKSVAISESDGTVTLNVHDLAHIIGNQAYKQDGLRGLLACDNAFAYGCFHGVTEQLLLESGPEVVEKTAKECRVLFPPGSPREDSYTGCLHGMGHGLLSWENMDLSRGLSWCNKLEKADRTFCFDGVFMEYAGGAGTQVFQEEDPWAICRNLGEEFHVACARYQPNLWQRIFLWDTAKSAKTCTEGPSATLRDNCTDSVGFIIAQGNPGDKEKIMQKCSSVGIYEYEAKCLTAAALENKFQRYTGWEKLSGEICESLAKPWDTYCALRLSRVK